MRTFATDSDRLWHGFQTSARISRRLHEMHDSSVRFYRPIDVVKTLNKAGIPLMVVGNYGSGAWRREPQANGDVDVLVASRSLSAAAEVVAKTFPRLIRSDEADSSAFHDANSRWKCRVYHLHRPTTRLMKVWFRNRVWVPDGRYHAPNLEWAIGSCFESSKKAASRRDWTRMYSDLGDMLSIATNPAVEIDRVRLRGLAAMIGRDAYRDMMAKINKSLAQVTDPQWHN